MSRTSYLCVLVFVAGCNSFYGLDETRPNRDEDGDGVRDKEDNCPTIPNSFQTDSHDDDGGDACAQCPAPIGIDLDEDLYDDGCDRCLGPGHPRGEALIDVDHDTLDDRCDPCVDGASVTEIDFNENGIGDGCEVCFEPPIGDIDGDGLDDACDPCLKGPPHDEDRDGHHDACDNCPFDFNPGQVSTMGGVGDACDRATTVPLERAVFEPFLVRDLFRWNSIAGAWTIANDRASLTGTGQRRLAIGFRGQFRFVMRSRLQGGAGLRVEVRNATQMAECKITPAGHVTFGTDAADLAIDGPLTIEVYYSAADILPFMHCQVTSGSSMVVVNADPLPQIVRITLEGTEPVGTFEIESVDLLTTIPPPTAN